MSEWQPIETAPKGGVRIPGFAETHDYFGIGFINAAREFELVDMLGRPMDVGFYPTHWMPLPPPPTTVSDAGQG